MNNSILDDNIEVASQITEQPKEKIDEKNDIIQNEIRKNQEQMKNEEKKINEKKIVEKEYFDDALFIGDSRTVGISEYGELNNATFFANTGMSVYNVFDKKVSVPKVTADVIKDLAFKADRLRRLGVCDIIVDPGFGFSKNVEQNYEMMRHLHEFVEMGYPVLVGISRKSMIYKLLGTKPEAALNGTTVLNTFALMQGAHILRVHDVKAAVEAVKIVSATNGNEF